MKWVIFLILLYSCGGDGTGYDHNGNLQSENDPIPLQAFSTRLTNNLLISGTPCDGTQSTEAEGQTFICGNGSWLVTIDDINTCTPDGCTEVQVVPTIALLIARGSDAISSFFEIQSAIPISDRHENILENVLVRFRNDLPPRVVFN